MTKQIRPRIAKLSPPQPKLCTRCLNILVLEGKQWRCPKGHQQPKQAA